MLVDQITGNVHLGRSCIITKGSTIEDLYSVSGCSVQKVLMRNDPWTMISLSPTVNGDLTVYSIVWYKNNLVSRVQFSAIKQSTPAARTWADWTMEEEVAKLGFFNDLISEDFDMHNAKRYDSVHTLDVDGKTYRLAEVEYHTVWGAVRTYIDAKQPTAHILVLYNYP